MFAKIVFPAVGVVAGIILGAQAMATQTSSLHGTVVRASGHAPLAGVLVNLYRGSSTESASTATTDSAGAFIMVDLAPGTYNLQLSRARYQTMIISDLALKPGEPMRFKDPIVMQTSTDSLPASQISACSSLLQPGQTADVYVVCSAPVQRK